MKQKYIGGKLTTLTTLYFVAVNDSCSEVLTHYNDMVSTIKPRTTEVMIDLDKLIEWAEKDPNRITWLLEKGYIEKVESEYDKWVGECPFISTNLSKTIQTYQEKFGCLPVSWIEWAKRMPK